MAIVSSVVLSSALVLGGQVIVDRTASAAASDVVGSWLLSLTDSTAPADQPPTPGLATFFADGTFIAYDYNAKGWLTNVKYGGTNTVVSKGVCP